MSERVSVIIPAYNAERYLGEAIESVLAQTRPPFEVIVVDDGSKDGTTAVAARFGTRVRTITQKNAGAPAARNSGIRTASGEFLGFLDADDRWTPEKSEAQLAAFSTDPELGMAFGHMKHFFSPECDAEFRQTIRCPDDAVPGISVDTLLIRHLDFMRVGFFDESLRMSAEFLDWYVRAKEAKLKEALLPGTFAERRLHTGNHGLVEREGRPNFLKVLKASLDRRRKASGGEGG